MSKNAETAEREVAEKEITHVIKIKGDTDPRAAAGSLTMVLVEHGFAWMYAIGAAAVNQATKAYIIAKGQVAPLGMKIIMDPSFETIKIDGKEKTRIKFEVEPR
jgi:stage V sporulation protein S